MATSTNYFETISNTFASTYYITQTDPLDGNAGRALPVTRVFDFDTGTIAYYTNNGSQYTPQLGEVAFPTPLRVELGNGTATIGNTVVSSLGSFTYSQGGGAVNIPTFAEYATIHVIGGSLKWVSTGILTIGDDVNRTSDGGYIYLKSQNEITNFQCVTLDGDTNGDLTLYIEFANKE